MQCYIYERISPSNMHDKQELVIHLPLLLYRTSVTLTASALVDTLLIHLFIFDTMRMSSITHKILRTYFVHLHV